MNAPCGCNNEVGDKFYACMQSEFAPAACEEKYLFYYSKGGTLKLYIKNFLKNENESIIGGDDSFWGDNLLCNPFGTAALWGKVCSW